MSDEMIDVTGIDPADLLAALYNAAKPRGWGHFQYEPEDMTADQAREILSSDHPDGDFDYLNGRAMKVRITENPLYVGIYDRDNGRGAALRAIQHLRVK